MLGKFYFDEVPCLLPPLYFFYHQGLGKDPLYFPSVPCPAIAGILSSIMKAWIVLRCIFPSVASPVIVEKVVIKHQQQHKAPEDDPCRYMFQIKDNTDADQYQLRQTQHQYVALGRKSHMPQ